MEVYSIRMVLEPFVQLFTSLILGGAAVTLATQIMKLNVIPVPAQKYPRTVAAIASAIASVTVVLTTPVNYLIDSLYGIAALAIGIYILAAVTYNQVIKHDKPAVSDRELG